MGGLGGVEPVYYIIDGEICTMSDSGEVVTVTGEELVSLNNVLIYSCNNFNGDYTGFALVTDNGALTMEQGFSITNIL